MKNLHLILIFLTLAITLQAQDKYFTRTAHISFFSDAPLEKIEAHHYQGSSFLTPSDGSVAFIVNIKGFEFDKALMQEHFNENYLESSKYPKASFDGKIVNFASLDLTKTGPQNIEVEGELSMHGVTRKIKATGTIEKKDEQLVATVTFPVLLKDYNISIPKMVEGKIAETVKVTIVSQYQPFKK